MQKIVVAGFILKEGRVLLAKTPKSRKLAPDKYHLRHVEYGEDLKSALKRELREEFRVDVEVDEPFFSFSYFTDDSHTIGLVCPVAILSSGNDFTLNRETDHIVWADEEALLQYLAADDHNFLAAKAGFGKTL